MNGRKQNRENERIFKTKKIQENDKSDEIIEEVYNKVITKEDTEMNER